MRTVVYYVVAVALLGLAPCQLYGQQALGDGRALDNSLRLGSGGTNARPPRTDYQARNAVITGNVSGLGYFHGRIPYREPGAFHGDLASNRLFRFHAQSLPPTRQTALGRTGPRRVYRSMDAISLGDLKQTPPGADLLVPRDAAFIDGRRQRYPGSEWAGAPSPVGVSFGLIEKVDGRRLELSASPLLGVRVAAPDGELTPGVIGRPLLAGEVGPGAADGAGEPGPADTLGWDIGTPGATALTGRVWPVRVEPRRVDGNVTTLAEQVADLESRVPIPHVAIHAKPGQDVYLDLLRSGLGQAARRPGDDALLPLLRRVWLADPPAELSPPAAAPAADGAAK